MKPTRVKTPSNKLRKNQSQDPVGVYCRLRPLENSQEEVCITPVGNNVVQLSPPGCSLAFKSGNAKELQYTFQHVFEDKASQKEVFDHVALPLVEDLVLGKNGLLFTYGITSSGKTYTMTGTPQDGGILPRCLDVIFNTINPFQAKKFVFIPDKMNGFDVQSVVDAMLERQQREVMPKTPTAQRKFINKDGELCDMPRVYDLTKVDIDEDNNYAVFVSYIEIYNNYVYDLLEDIYLDANKSRPPQSKNMREDSNHNMYVASVTELEVKSTEEAFDMFCKGQRRRRVAHTQLNTESSRSHSVFNIRLVQAPLDPLGEEILQDKSCIHISQLSLVDLAGSERTARTRNAGDRLREAGNINNSLMVLRSCIEILRENQLYMANKIVPYRDTKLTHLFKNYFDGEGKVKMIVCINPKVDEYDETLHVMRFAELTQEVQIARPNAVRFDLGLTPGRRQAAQTYKEVIKKMVEEGVDLGLIDVDTCGFGGQFPPLELTSLSDDKLIPNLINFLEERNKQRNYLLLQFSAKQNAFRTQLIDLYNSHFNLQQETMHLRSQLKDQDKSRQKYEMKIKSLERENEALRQQMALTDLEKRELQTQGKRLWATQTEMQTKILMKDEKLRQLKEIAENPRDNIRVKENYHAPMTPSRIKPAKSEPRLNYVSRTATRFGGASKFSDIKSHSAGKPLKRSQSPPPQKLSAPTATLRHRRSKSASDDVWLEHKPPGNIELDTVLQPTMKKKRSVTKINIKDTQQSSRYVLQHQEVDSAGEVETQLIKGDICPTVGGGANVVFSDVETLKQTSPNSRKRHSSEHKSDFEMVPERCAVGIENHSSAANLDPSLQHIAKKYRP